MRTQVNHEFVETIPDHLEEGVVYVSIAYATSVHLCCCGCGHEVVTPLHPRRWSLIFDGETITLTPSIGNWSFPCRSHYWIRLGQVYEARPFTSAEVARLRAGEHILLAEHYGQDADVEVPESATLPESWRTRSARWFGKRLRRGHERRQL